MMTMKCQIVFLIQFVLVSLDVALCQTTSTEWPYDSKITFPYATFAPINVNSSAAAWLVAPPIEFTNALLDVIKVVNTGKAIEAFLAFGNTTCSVTGGPVFKNQYRFHKIRLYWNNKKAKCRTTIDGRGEPLEVMLIYFKAEYGSFGKALFHRDGLVVCSIRITLQPMQNTFFSPVQKILTQIQKTGSYYLTISSIFCTWFNVIKQTQIYYTYPGSYVDLQTGRMYSSTIEVVFEPIVGYISTEQFVAFQNLRNIFGAPLENVSPIFPAGNRPIRKGTGTYLKFTLV